MNRQTQHNEKRYTVKRKSKTTGFRGSQWNTYIKEKGFAAVVNESLNRVNRPLYVWRNQVCDDIILNGGFRGIYSERVLKQIISVCLSDKEITGYTHDGSKSTVNPRFMRVVD